MENISEINNIEKSQEQLKQESIKNGYIIKNIYPRKNETVYTQGLILNNENENLYLYESGGLYEKSSITKMNWPNQEIIKKILLDKKYFGEGITLNENNDKLYQLTWKEKEILVYNNLNNDLIFEKIIELPKEIEEGWGFCKGLNSEYYVSNGTNKIYIIELKNNLFEIKNILNVKYEKINLDNINDLVFVNNFIWANRYYDDEIFKINSINGKLEKNYSMKPLINYELETGQLTKETLNEGNVLNGITYNNLNKTFILTGKFWDNYYEIEFIE